MFIDYSIKYLFIALTLIIATHCSTTPRSILSNPSNPREEIHLQTESLNQARLDNIDVLARQDYFNSFNELQKAQDSLAKGHNTTSIITLLRFSKDHLKKAYLLASKRQHFAPELLADRRFAIEAGALQSIKIQKDIDNLDEFIANKIDGTNLINPEKLKSYQLQYLKIEKDTVVEKMLAKTYDQINRARNAHAAKYTPQILRKADASSRNAESFIASHIRHPAGYKNAVDQAIIDAQLMTDLIDIIQQNGGQLSETAALKMLEQTNKIIELNAKLSNSQTSLLKTQIALQEQKKSLTDSEHVLHTTSNNLIAANATIAIQHTLESLKNNFLPEEAETYQQNGLLVIRLKSLAFSNGQSQLPSHSHALLDKVVTIMDQLNAKNITVEGHTDSIGKSEVNRILSKQRARSVAEYLKSHSTHDLKIVISGQGFNNPIASNKTLAGRKQNRRVDILITPSTDLAIAK